MPLCRNGCCAVAGWQNWFKLSCVLSFEFKCHQLNCCWSQEPCSWPPSISRCPSGPAHPLWLFILYKQPQEPTPPLFLAQTLNHNHRLICWALLVQGNKFQVCHKEGADKAAVDILFCTCVLPVDALTEKREY